MLKLAKLPDRTPVKIAIALMPGLHQELCDYAEVYRDTYGEAEPVAELIPQCWRRSSLVTADLRKRARPWADRASAVPEVGEQPERLLRLPRSVAASGSASR